MWKSGFRWPTHHWSQKLQQVGRWSKYIINAQCNEGWPVTIGASTGQNFNCLWGSNWKPVANSLNMHWYTINIQAVLASLAFSSALITRG